MARARSRVRYARSLDDHILPTLGEWYVDAITPDACVEWRDGAAAKTGRALDVPVSRTYTISTKSTPSPLALQDLGDIILSRRRGAGRNGESKMTASKQNVYAIIEGQRGQNGRTLRMFASATACLTAFFSGGYEGRAHFKRIG